LGVALSPVNVNEVYPDWLYYELKPGETINDQFSIWNGYNQKVNLKLGALDAKDNSTLENFQLTSEYNDEQKTIGKWVNVTPSLELNSEEFTEISFILSLPENTKEGEYWGALYADYEPEQGNAQFRTVVQTGLRIILKVTNTPHPPKITAIHEWKNVSNEIKFPIVYFGISVTIMLAAAGLVLVGKNR